MNVGQWLIQEGVYRDLIAALVGVAVTTLVGFIPFRKSQRRSAKVADALDTSTPGGLTDVMYALNQINATEASGPSSAPGDSGGS